MPLHATLQLVFLMKQDTASLSLLTAPPPQKKIQSTTKILFFHQGNFIFTKRHFLGEKEQDEKDPYHCFLLLWQCQGVCQAVCQMALSEPSTLCLLPTSAHLEQTQNMLPTFCLVHSQLAAYRWGKITKAIWKYYDYTFAEGSLMVLPISLLLLFFCSRISNTEFFRIQ